MKLIDLVFSTNKIRKRQYETNRIGAIDAKYIERTKQIYFAAQARSADKKSNSVYKVSFVFDAISSSASLDKVHTIPYRPKEYDTERYLRQPTVSHNVRVRCSCPDNYFMWQYYNKKNKSLVGPFKPYIPVSPPSGRPPVNPRQLPGCCKHQLALLKILMEQGAVKKNAKVLQYINRKTRTKE